MPANLPTLADSEALNQMVQNLNFKMKVNRIRTEESKRERRVDSIQ